MEEGKRYSMHKKSVHTVPVITVKNYCSLLCINSAVWSKCPVITVYVMIITQLELV